MRRAPQAPVADEVIFAQPTMTAAIRLAANVSGLEEKEIYLPLKIDASHWTRILNHILAIQAACNREAAASGRPPVDILNAEEEARIRELIASETWPDGWDGDEPHADELIETIYQNGAVQPLLFKERA
jgi:hypothetical protein